jgi:hypothetical protein
MFIDINILNGLQALRYVAERPHRSEEIWDSVRTVCATYHARVDRTDNEAL